MLFPALILVKFDLYSCLNYNKVNLVLYSVAVALLSHNYSWLTCAFTGLSSRCFQCRSRGELGDCRDHFPYNETSVRSLAGEPISVTPCPSGWCSKQVEGIRGPPDGMPILF